MDINISIKDAEELLNYLQETDIIDLASTREKLEMTKKEKILKEHPYRIWLASDGYWKSYIDENGEKKLLKKKQEEDLKNAIVKSYTDPTKYTIKVRFNDWMKRQECLGRSVNTIYKYECDYKRLIKGDKIERMDIRKITEEDICKFLNRILSDENKQVRWRALKDLFGYFKGMFEKAIRDRLITENPCTYVDLPLFRSKCYNPPEKTPEERTLSDNERKVLLNKVHYSKNVGDMAVEFTMYTGMRVGELAALKWEDINLDRKTITIRRSEKRNRKTNERYIADTKNHKIRTIPLTDSMWEVLQRVKKYELQMGWLGEFIFQDENGRVKASKISDRAVEMTQSSEFVNKKSVHAIRRTINSNMRCSGVPSTVAASILGHSEKVNEMNYTYDMTSMEEKSKCLEMAVEM